VLSALAGALCVGAAACGDDAPPPRAKAPAAAVERVRATPTVAPPPPAPSVEPPVTVPPPACASSVDAPTILPGTHVPEGTEIPALTNPPAGGPHYPRWANFQEFDHPIPDGYLVHSLEHGAVALLYKCEPDACAETILALRAVRDALEADPQCDPTVRVRIVIAPRPELEFPVAAAAWGSIYRAECLDVPSLTQFIHEHYAKAPEDLCAPGVTSL
jgi:hypothetical protein